MTQETLQLERVLTRSGEATHPALHGAVSNVPPIAVVVGSLAIGGAERIVLDWMHRNANRYQFRMLVLKSIRHEWPVPENVHVVRVSDGASVSDVIEAFARETSGAWLSAGFGKPSVLCHITKAGHRSALERGGVIAVPVLHNAQQGWGESVDDLSMAGRVVAVSQACAGELARLGRRTGVQLIRHIPSALGSNVAERALLRARLCATVGIAPGPGTKLMAMIGGVKPQKNYLRAVQVLARLAAAEDCYLVIFGGPIGSQGQEEWQRVRGEILRLGVEDRVRVTGFVPHAAAALRAFDVFLNTSHFEGL